MKNNQSINQSIYFTHFLVEESEKFIRCLNKSSGYKLERACIGLGRVRQGQAVFKQVSSYVKDKDFLMAQGWFKEMYRFVEEAKELVGDSMSVALTRI